MKEVRNRFAFNIFSTIYGSHPGQGSTAETKEKSIVAEEATREDSDESFQLVHGGFPAKTRKKRVEWIFGLDCVFEARIIAMT